MKIYIASSWKNQHGVEMLTSLLRANGHRVTSWVENNYGETHNHVTKKFSFDEWMKSPESEQSFVFDTEGATTCDLMIFYVYYGCAFTHSTSGSRLCYQTEEQAGYAATTFLWLYEEFMTIMPDLEVPASEPAVSAAPGDNKPAVQSDDAALRKYALELAIGTGDARIVDRAEEYYKFLTAA